MQALSNHIPWISDFIHDRAQDKFACYKPRHLPLVEIPFSNKLKRKRSDGVNVKPSADGPTPPGLEAMNVDGNFSMASPLAANHDARQEADSCSTQKNPTSLLAHPLDDKAKARITKMAADPVRRAKLQQKIEGEFNHQILLKHEELRCIEQELAKCQIALEQLRRCREIPYPSEPGSQVTFEQLRNGTGPSLRPRTDSLQSQSPAAWGVTDGPYTRHYVRWLLPDPHFDSALLDTPRPASSASPLVGTELRTTRGSFAADRTSFVASRAQRASIASKLHSMSANYATPKDRHGPLIVKRASDGQLVKLICRFCQKDNISSVQGFLNHCRLAHDKNYESHTAAAIDCGVLLDGTENTNTVAVPDPATPSIRTNERPLVHPLILRNRAAPVGPVIPWSPLRRLSSSALRQSKLRTEVSTSSPLQGFTTMALVPSHKTPGLAALLEKRGLGCDLRDLVAATTVRINLADVDTLKDDGEDEEETPITEDVTTSNTSLTTGIRKPIQTTQTNTALVSTEDAATHALQPSNNKPRSPQMESSRLFADADGSARSSLPGVAEAVKPTLSPLAIDTNPGLEEDVGSDASQVSEDDENHDPSESIVSRRPSVWVNGDNDEIMRDVRDYEMKVEQGPSTAQAAPMASVGRGGRVRRGGRSSRRGTGGVRGGRGRLRK